MGEEGKKFLRIAVVTSHKLIQLHFKNERKEESVFILSPFALRKVVKVSLKGELSKLNLKLNSFSLLPPSWYFQVLVSSCVRDQ